MRKSDLKTGMRVENRRGDIYMVLTDVYSEHYGNQKIAFVNYDMFSCGDNYKEDLTSALSGNSDIDIVKVYNISKDPTLLRNGMLNLNERHLIWERPTKKMTKAEIEKILGYKIEIIGMERVVDRGFEGFQAGDMKG